MIDADVVCKELGYPGVEDTFVSGDFGTGNGPILIDGVECSGNETSFFDCPSNEYYTNNCSHDQDVGIKCFGKNYVDMYILYIYIYVMFLIVAPCVNVVHC